jgi:hypothetical protein
MTIDQIEKLQIQLANMMEDIGSLALHLREAKLDIIAEAPETALLCLDDAQEAAAQLEHSFSEIGAAIARIAEGGAA